MSGPCLPLGALAHGAGKVVRPDRPGGSAVIIGAMSGIAAARAARRAARRAAGVALAGGLALAILAVGPAVAASGTATVTLSAAVADPGDVLTVTAAGLGGAGEIPILLAGPGTSVQLGMATADSAGAFRTTVTIPAGTADGDYDVIVYDTAEELIEAPLHVGPPTTGEATATDTSDLGQDTATPPGDSGADVTPTAAPSDPYPVPEGIRDITFVLLVAGSLALAAWGAGPGRRP